MLSLHAPQNLAAELGLLAVCVLIVLYRFLGGTNEWLRTHGVILASYYSLGGLVYDELEGWTLLDTTYFLTVTVTTVGYGDMCPETDIGKIFTVVYALLGLIFVFAALDPLLQALIFIKDTLLAPFTPKEPTDIVDESELTLEHLRRGGNWSFKYGSALAGPLIVFLLGLIIGYTVMGLGTVDGVYWSMITMTTIGYGDISGGTFIERAVLILYLPTAVAALADALSAVGAIGTAKDVVFTNFDSRCDELLLGEAGGTDPNPEETLTEAEFLVTVLKDKGIIDDLTVSAIRMQFAHITRHDTWSEDPSNKVLDDRCVFCELRAQERIRPALHGCVPEGAPTVDANGYAIEYVDTRADDGGFGEWRERCWLPRVFDGHIYEQGPVRQGAVRAPTSANLSEEAKERREAGEDRRVAGGDPRAGRKRSTRAALSANTPIVVAHATPPVAGGYAPLPPDRDEGVYVLPPKRLPPPVHSRPKRMGPPSFCDHLMWACGSMDTNGCLWVVVLIFGVIFITKIVPDVWEHEYGEPLWGSVIGGDTD